MQRRPDLPPHGGPGDPLAQPTLRIRTSGTPATSTPQPVAPPRSDPDGGLATHIAAVEHETHVVGRARDARDRAQHDVASVARSLAEIAGVLHTLAANLEQFVEGSFSRDLADPRMQVLSHTLAVARQADLQLARLGNTLRQLGDSVRTAGAGIDTLQQERERLSSLYRIAQDLNSTLDLDDVLGRVMARLIEVVRAQRGFLMLWDDASKSLQFAAARGADGRPLAQADFTLSQGVVEGVWRDQQPMLTLDAQADERFAERESVVAYGIRSIMCAPLRVRGRGVGIVYVDSRSDANLFDAASLDLLAAFCNQAAIALDNARLFDELRRHLREISAMKAYTDNIFASIASGVVTADTLGAVTAFNRAAERIFDIPGERAVGHPYADVLATAGGDDLSAIMRRAVAEQQVTLGHELTREIPGRGEVCLRLNVSPLRDEAGTGEPLGVAMVVDDLTELRRSQRQAEEIQRLFGRYVHPAVVRQLLADPSAVTLGGETREISVVFADIRGYTALAERLDPAALVRVLNIYLELLTEAIWREEGTLTMYIGDALMAIFNAPLPQPDHALRAVRAAWGMREALERHAADPATGAVPVQYGIGVHTGLAVVGNIGAQARMQNYTAIGDAVNTAQRIQANASANQILLSSATYIEAAPHIVAHALDPLAVKGKTHPLSVYHLDGLR
jgi:adenylate cyclase